MFRSKSQFLLIGALVGLAVLGLLLGWGAHALADWLGGEAAVTPLPQSPITATPMPETPTSAPPDILPPTSTLAPQQQIIVQSGESLYAVCRRYCPQNWALVTLDDALRQYSEQVATLNNLAWNDAIKGYVIHPGNVLKMPPCPER
ncbi:MAG: LysM peptidoglycan-binding domain-containing protein [Anaerolineae bacterium]|nr:LysM peptidoglycan-binding domain-containing protein [Anaerolineae bacterium]